MVVSKSVWNALMKQDPKVLEELTRARNMSEVSKNARKEIRKALDSSNDRRLSGMPVVELSREGMRKLHEEQKLKQSPLTGKTAGIVFGRDMNLDGSFAGNLDREMARAERLGVLRSEARAKVAVSVMDFHTIYKNSQDAEKALGTAREMFAAPQYQPDRQNEVAESIDEALAHNKTINFGKYAKWNDRADEEERKRREQEEKQRLEEERISRDERERDGYEELFPSIFR